MGSKPSLTLPHSQENNMSKFKGTIVVDTERCKGCNLCAIACPQDLIQLSHMVNRCGYNYATQINSQQCNGCSSCGIICPDACITVYRIKE